MNVIATLAGVAGGTGIRLVSAGQARSPAVFTRAQVSTSATAIGLDGVTWQAFGSDAPRRSGSTPRLIIEGQRVNGLRNPRFEGGANGVIGSGGSLPTNLSIAVNAVAGLSCERVGVVTVNGVTCLRLRLFGTTTAGGNYFLFLDSPAGIPAVQGDTFTQSCFLQQQVATGTAPSVQFRPMARSSTSVALTAVGGANQAVTSTLTRFAATWTIPDAAAAFVQPALCFVILASRVYDVTFDIGWPQVERSSFVSTPILPSAGSPAASIRGADILSTTLSALSIGGNGACTVLWAGALFQAAATAPQTLFQVDAGDSNSFAVRNEASGSGIAVIRTLSGASASAAAGTMVARTAFRAGMTLNGAGRAAASVNGATAVAVTGGPTSGLTTLRIGNNSAADAAMFGETRSLLVLRTVLPDADLARWTSAPLD